MGLGTTALLGAIAGSTIFLGLPIARLRRLDPRIQGLLNAIATGILIFLVWDVISKADEPIRTALADLRSKGQAGRFAGLLATFVTGFAVGLLSLVYFNRVAFARIARQQRRAVGPGALAAGPLTRATPSAAALAMMIAVGLGLHNFSEGLAIGQSAANGAISLALMLIIGFGLHNITEGFGIAAPLASAERRPSWRFLMVAGLIGGGPTFLGTIAGYSFTSTYVFVLFLSLAAGSLVYVIGEMFAVGRRMNVPAIVGWGILLGFTAGYGTDLLLSFAGA